jgi:hypothetical protein
LFVLVGLRDVVGLVGLDDEVVRALATFGSVIDCVVEYVFARRRA